MPQRLVLFYPENTNDDLQEKLINLFVNRLCIDEDDQYEVIAIKTWKVMDSIENLSFFTNMLLRFVSFGSNAVLRTEFTCHE